MIVFVPELLQKENKPNLETLRSQPRAKPKPRNEANQNHCQPNGKPKKIEADFGDWTKPTWTFANAGNTANKNAENLKTCLLRKYWPKLLTWKTPPLKKDLNFWANRKANLVNQIWLLALLFGSATQRFALPALGQGRRSRPARKMIRRGKLLGMCAESPASGARFVSLRFFEVTFAIIINSWFIDSCRQIKLTELRSRRIMMWR